MPTPRTFAVAVALVASSSAFASFDLALVSDAGTNTIHRFDPISNVYLGSFGGGILVNPRGVVVDQATNSAYVLDATSRVTRWNYNTGAFVSSFNTGVPGASFLTRNSDGTLNVAGTSSVVRFGAAGNPLVTYNRSGTLGIQQGILLSDGQFYMSTRTGSSRSLERFNYATGAFQGFNVWFADRLTPTSALPGVNALNVYDGATGASIWGEPSTFSSGPQSTFSSTDNTLLLSVRGTALGHGTMSFILGSVRATPTQFAIQRFDYGTATFGATLLGQGIIQNGTGLATVVAPEPATMAALGLGLAALLKRRRR